MPRAQHKPTAETRASVKALAKYGIIETEIAAYIGIDPKTLRKHYRTELDESFTKANLRVAQALYDSAITQKNVSAQIFWLKVRAGWREKEQIDIDQDRKLKELQIKKAMAELEILKKSPKDAGTVAELLKTLISDLPD